MLAAQVLMLSVECRDPKDLEWPTKPNSGDKLASNVNEEVKE